MLFACTQPSNDHDEDEPWKNKQTTDVAFALSQLVLLQGACSSCEGRTPRLVAVLVAMDGDSRFSYGWEPSTSSLPMDQLVTIPQHSTLAQPRVMITGGVNPLDLTSAIQHELRRANSQPWNQQQQFCGSLSHASSLDADSTTSEFISIGYGFEQPTPQQAIPFYIPRFDEALAPATMQTQLQMSQRLHAFPPNTAPAPYSSSSRSANGLPPSHPAQQVMEAGARATGESMRSYSPWIERMMQADVTPTPSPMNVVSLSTSLSLAREQRTAQGEVSCVFSQTVDSSDRRSAQSMRSVFGSEPSQHESTMELSADVCTDDDLDTRPSDVKRKKRMLSNRASAQRSRQRRQERLDQLEVLTAKLRVENSALHKKWITAMQTSKKFEDQNKDLLKKVDRLSKELEVGSGGRRARKLEATTLNDNASSQQTACASSCEMVGERPIVDPSAMRAGNGASTTPSMSPSSAGRPVGRSPESNERDTDVVSNGGTNNNNYKNNNSNNNNGNSNTYNNNASHQVSSVRKSFSACRTGKKRSCEDTATADSHGSLYLLQPRPLRDLATLEGAPCALEPGRGPLWHELGSDGGPSLRDDFLEADRWLEFPECLL